MYGRPGVAGARRALHDSVLPLLRSSQSPPVLLIHGVSRPGPPQGPMSQRALCTPRVLANAVNKAMFSVLAGVSLFCLSEAEGLGVLCTLCSGFSETVSISGPASTS